MKKIISFEKKITFPTMIGEITAISLEHNLKFIDTSNIEGELEVTGNYKLTEASRLEEKFDYKLPADIVLSEKLDLSTAKIEIDDFYYEIEGDDQLICYIDIKVEGVEEIDFEEQTEPILEAKESPRIEPIIEEQELLTPEEKIPKVEETIIRRELETTANRECDGDNILEEEIPKLEKTKEIPKEEIMVNEKEVIIEKKEVEEQTVGSLFSSLKESDETFATYSVYILRQEESITSLIEKYKTTKEELESYNDLSNLTIGTKIIIPRTNE